MVSGLLLTLLILGFFASGVGVVAMFIRLQTKRMELEFETKMAMAQAQSNMKDNAAFDQLCKDIDYIISFYVIHEFSFVQEETKKGNANEDQLLEQFVSFVSAKTLLCISEEMKRQFSLYATVPDDMAEGDEDFLTYFIRKESLTKTLARAGMK